MVEISCAILFKGKAEDVLKTKNEFDNILTSRGLHAILFKTVPAPKRLWVIVDDENGGGQ